MRKGLSMELERCKRLIPSGEMRRLYGETDEHLRRIEHQRTEKVGRTFLVEWAMSTALMNKNSN